LTWDRFMGIFYIVDGLIALALAVLLKGMLFDIVDQGKFKEASERMLILGIIGLFAAGIPGILLILGYVRMQEVFQPQYQQYHPQNASVAPPQQVQQQQAPAQYQQTYQQPAPQPAPQNDQMQTLRDGIKADQATTEQKKKDQKTEMIKCSKCGVQFPSFMHACPNCNEPKSR
jgi:type VI protein secretion system component VasK